MKWISWDFVQKHTKDQTLPCSYSKTMTDKITSHIYLNKTIILEIFGILFFAIILFLLVFSTLIYVTILDRSKIWMICTSIAKTLIQHHSQLLGLLVQFLVHSWDSFVLSLFIDVPFSSNKYSIFIISHMAGYWL